MKHVTVDFETRSREDLKTRGRYNYFNHPSTEVLCLAFRLDDAPVELWTRNTPIPPQLAAWVSDPAICFHAHNAEFERLGWRMQAARLGWPEMPDEKWRCTAARSAYQNVSRNLDGAAKTLLPKEYHKDSEGHKVMMKLCKPDRKGDWVEDPALFDTLHEYCKQDVLAESELGKVVPELSDEEQDVWLETAKLNDRGVPIDRKLCQGVVEIVDHFIGNASEEVSKITDGEITAPTQVCRILKYANERGVNVGDMQACTVTYLLKSKNTPPDIRRLLEIRQATSSAAVKKFRAALNLTCEDDRVRGLFMYYGAATGRFSSLGLQLHNFKRGDKEDKKSPQQLENEERLREVIYDADVTTLSMLEPSPIDFLGNIVRWMVKAPEGHKFILSDLGQIEARVLHWLAQDEDMMELFRTGLDPYIRFASRLFDKSEALVTDEERTICKVAVLGLGYGMGASRFNSYSEQYGLSLTDPFCQKVVKFYRDSNPKITKLWQALDYAALSCSKTGRSFRVGAVRFDKDGRFLVVTLPSGRKLFYLDPEARQSGRGERFFYMSSRYGLRCEWAGGLLTENIVQAIARDILTMAMLRARDEGLDIILHVHDELGILESDEKVESSTKVLEKCLTQVPNWAKDLPLKTDSRIRQRFVK